MKYVILCGITVLQYGKLVSFLYNYLGNVADVIRFM